MLANWSRWRGPGEEGPVTTDQILFGVGLILVLATASQVLAVRLRVPALIILLPAGFIAGALTTDVNPQRLLGAAFQPLVSLAVAVILYDAGLALDMGKLRGHTRRVVRRLIGVGVPVTSAFAAVSAGLLLGMSAGAALMLGAILVVSGPTVVGPLLRFIRIRPAPVGRPHFYRRLHMTERAREARRTRFSSGLNDGAAAWKARRGSCGLG